MFETKKNLESIIEKINNHDLKVDDIKEEFEKVKNSEGKTLSEIFIEKDDENNLFINCNITEINTYVISLYEETIENINQKLNDSIEKYAEFKKGNIDFSEVESAFKEIDSNFGLSESSTDDEIYNYFINLSNDGFRSNLFKNVIIDQLVNTNKLAESLKSRIENIMNNVSSAITNPIDFDRLKEELNKYNKEYSELSEVLEKKYDEFKLSELNSKKNDALTEISNILNGKEIDKYIDSLKEQVKNVYNVEQDIFEIKLSKMDDDSKIDFVNDRITRLETYSKEFAFDGSGLDFSKCAEVRVLEDSLKEQLSTAFEEVYSEIKENFNKRKEITIDPVWANSTKLSDKIEDSTLEEIENLFEDLDITELKSVIDEMVAQSKEYAYPEISTISDLAEEFEEMTIDSEEIEEIKALEDKFEEAKEIYEENETDVISKRNYEAIKNELYNKKKEYCDKFNDLKSRVEEEFEKLENYCDEKDIKFAKKDLISVIKNKFVQNKSVIFKIDITKVNQCLEDIYLGEQALFERDLNSKKLTFDEKMSLVEKRDSIMSDEANLYKDYNYSTIYIDLCNKKGITPNDNIKDKLNKAFEIKREKIVDKYNESKELTSIYLWSHINDVKASKEYIESNVELKEKVDNFKEFVDDYIDGKIEKEEYDNKVKEFREYVTTNNLDNSKIYPYMNAYVNTKNKKLSMNADYSLNGNSVKKPVKFRHKVVNVIKNIGNWIKNNKLKAIVLGLALLIGIPLLLQSFMIINSFLWNALAGSGATLANAGGLCNLLHSVNIGLAKVSTFGLAKFEGATGLWKLGKVALYGQATTDMLAALARLGIGSVAAFQIKRHIIDKIRLSLSKKKLDKLDVSDRTIDEESEYEEFAKVYNKYEKYGENEVTKPIFMRKIINFMINHNIKSIEGLKEFIAHFKEEGEEYALIDSLTEADLSINNETIAVPEEEMSHGRGM